MKFPLLPIVLLATLVGLLRADQATGQPPTAVSQTSYRPARPATLALPDLGLERLALFGHRRWGDSVTGTPVYMPDQGAVVIDDNLSPGGQAPDCNVYDYGDCCNPPPPWAHRSSIWADYLYLRARDAELVYAAPVDGPVTPPGNPANPGNQVGPLGMVDPDFKSAYRVGFWWARDDATSWGASYTRFESHATSRIEAEPGDFIQSLVTHPGVLSAASNWQQARARLDVDFDQLDADFRWLLASGCNYGVNVLAGARYGRLKQDFHSVFLINGSRTVVTDTRFRGAGLQLGLDGARYLPQTGWVAYGRGMVSLLAGTLKARYHQSSAFAAREVATAWEADRIVPTIDLEMGIGWRSRCDRLRLSAGYLYSVWLNTVAMDEWIDAVNANSFAGLGDDAITFDGLVARAEWRF